jgi:LysR family transcriptional regulator, transcriptional activator of nhaA
MDALNYHHLHYFWLVAREGSIARAATELKLSRPTISTQLRQLEASMGRALFERSGRSLVLTQFGQTVYRYADEIFSIGRELRDVVQGDLAGRPQRLVVGTPEVLPKLITHQLLKPAFELPDPMQVACHEGTMEDLLAELAVHRLDVVLSDTPLGSTTHVRGYNHLLGECGVSFFASSDKAPKYRRRFPQSLNGAAVLVPMSTTSLRRELDRWFDTEDIHPRLVGEFDDSALMKVFGQDGFGIFPAPSAIEKDVCDQYNVRVVGRVEVIRERYYAISVSRKLKHPAVVAICEAAREELFESA